LSTNATENVCRYTIARDDGQSLSFHPVDNDAFVRDLVTCEAAITTAGNQLIGEAFHLGKPVLENRPRSPSRFAPSKLAALLTRPLPSSDTKRTTASDRSMGRRSASDPRMTGEGRRARGPRTPQSFYETLGTVTRNARRRFPGSPTSTNRH